MLSYKHKNDDYKSYKQKSSYSTKDDEHNTRSYAFLVYNFYFN